MQVQLAGQDFKRSYGVPYLRLVNLFLEQQSTGGILRFPRGGLVHSYSIGSGPIRGLYQVSGLFNGDRFAVSGQTLYRETTNLGSVPGTDDIRWASSDNQLVLVADGQALLYDGTSLSLITLPDFSPVSDVVYLSGRFVYSVKGSGRFYWSEVNDAGNIDPLNFATAESGADAIIGMSTLNDDLYLFGAQTVEIWASTTSADLPFQRPPGRKYNRGCISRDSIAYADNSLFWVGENLIVYQTGAVPQRVSDFSVEERLAKCSNPQACEGWSITYQGHEIYLLNIPGQGSVCLDRSNGKWVEWSSYQRPVFRGRCASMINGLAYIGDDQTGQIGVLTSGTYTDYGLPLTGEVSFWIDQPGGLGIINNLVLQGARGVGNLNQSEPVVALALSRDMGQTYDDWDTRGLGPHGAYGDRAVWLRKGRVSEPGILGVFRSNDPVLFSSLQVLVNVSRPYG